MPLLDHVARYYAEDRAAWRAWLKKHHATETSVWLVYDKKIVNGHRPLSYVDIVEEALCFGWIDSLPRKLSDAQGMLYMSKRKPKSEWSKLNKSRIDGLIERKLMTQAGLDAIEVAKANGSWSMIDTVENFEIPPELAEAFAKDQQAKENFDAFAPHWRKALLHKINAPKSESTRLKKLALVMELCAGNVTAQRYRKEWLGQ